MTNRNLFFFCLGALLGWHPLVAQVSPAPERSSGAERSPAGLRGWIFPTSGPPQLVLACLVAGEEASRVLASSTGEERVAPTSYVELPAGRTELALKAGDKILATTAGTLAEGRQYTVIASRQGDDWKLKVFADGPSKSANSTRYLRVCNFAGGRETLLSLQGAPEVKVSPDALHEVEIAPGVVGVSVKVLAPDGGAPAYTSTEVDFTHVPSAYVVIGPDYRGRMRPTVVQGGVSTAAPVYSYPPDQVESAQP